MFDKLFAFLKRFFFQQPTKVTVFLEVAQPDTTIVTPAPVQNLLQLNSGYSLEQALELAAKSVSYMLEPELSRADDAPVFKPGYTAQDYQQIYRRNLIDNLVLMGITIEKLSAAEQTRLLGICKPPVKVNAQK
jgi:hypothetical protein